MLKDKKVIVDMSLRNKCKSNSTTKQSALPIQVTPVVEQEVGIRGKRKSLYSLTVDGCSIRVIYQVSTKTRNSGIYTTFHTPTRKQSKMLYCTGEEGVQTVVDCYFILKTGCIGISSRFLKQNNWNGGAATNPDCSTFLGVVVAERVLSKVFKNVQRMAQGNPGYDFICGKGFKIDVKGSCLRKKLEQWNFHIERNQEADYFLCLAFDNRKDLNPLHIWLIPGDVLNHLIGTSIARSTLEKWSKYELTDKLGDVLACCDTLKDQS